MKILDLNFKNAKAPTITATNSTTVMVNIPQYINKLIKCDLHLIFESASVFSKDITFRLINNLGTSEDFAFWDNSLLTNFTVFGKLLNHNYGRLDIVILNNDAVDDIVVNSVLVRFYYD